MASRLLGPSVNVMPKLAQLCQQAGKHVPGIERSCRKFSISSVYCKKKSETKRKSLALFSLMMQDGEEFKDMPALVRILSDLKPPTVHNYSYSGSHPSLNDFDLELQLHLKDAKSLHDIYDRLHIPTDQISAESAAYALQKICLLKEEKIKGDHPDTFLSAAILNELYNTVSRDIGRISCSTLFMLLDTFYSLRGWENFFGENIHEEIENRIGSSVFNFEELCSLSDVLCRYEEIADCSDLLEKVWIHVRNRWRDINADSIAQIYAGVPKKYFKDVQDLLSKQIKSIYWKLNSSDVRVILSELQKRNSKSIRELPYFGEWTAISFNQILEADMSYIIKSFMNLDYVDETLLYTMSKYIPGKLKSNSLSLEILLQSLDYCKFARFIDDKLLRVASEHFIKHYKSYSHKQVHTLMTVYSFLSYTPADYLNFFFNLEEYLHQEVYDMDCRILMDIVTSLLFLNRNPFTLYKHIFSYRFFAEVKEVPGKEHDILTSQINHYEDSIKGYLVTPDMFHLTFRLEVEEHTRALIYRQGVKKQSKKFERQCESLRTQLENIYGPQNVLCDTVVEYGVVGTSFHITHVTGKCVFGGLRPDFLFGYDLRKRRGQLMQGSEGTYKGLAVILLGPESFCLNQPDRLLGREVAYARHLRLSGYIVPMLRIEDFEQTSWDLPEQALKKKLKSLSVSYYELDWRSQNAG